MTSVLDTASSGAHPPTSPTVRRSRQKPGDGLASSSSMDRYPFSSGTSDGQEEPSHKSPHKAPPLAALAGRFSLQAPVFCAGAAGCALVIVAALRSAEDRFTELFHIYYQPLLVLLAMLWLWGANVRFFEGRRVRYGVCFSPHDQAFLLSGRQIHQAAALLTGVVLSSGALFAYHCAQGQLALAALHPVAIYSALLLLLLLPVDFVFRDTRMFFAQTLLRVATPVREVSWADFLLADVLTSLSKALSDLERASCHLLTGPIMAPQGPGQVCGSSSWILPLGLALPYAWRLAQCLRVYRDTGARPQLFNALKYSTAFPVILFSALKYQVTPAAWAGVYKPLWLAAALLNSGYSYFWDLERDWEIQAFTGPPSGERCCGLSAPAFKSELLFGKPVYYYLMVSNLLLRLSWTYKLSPHLRHNFDTVLLFTLLEAFRRFQWAPVRVEVELRKLQHARPELGQLIPPPPAGAEAGAAQKLLGKEGSLAEP